MYATPADLIAKYGETEIVRLSGGRDAGGLVLDQARVEAAIADATATVDSYLRARYAVPLASPPREVVLAVLVLARHELAHGDGRGPTEQMIEARKETIRWLERVGAGSVKIAGAAGAAEGETAIADAAAPGEGSRFQDRMPTITADGRGFI
mgnify:CR=1 FL=1